MALGAFLSVPACGGQSRTGLEPAASLASTRAAQRDFRTLHRRWTVADPVGRLALEKRLLRFVDRHPKEDLTRVVRVYLGWIYVERRQFVKARAFARETLRGPHGSVKDAAIVVEAAIRTREGRPDEALRLLEPLRGKVVDPAERFLAGEEMVRAAIAADRWDVVLVHMIDWLAQAAPEDREAATARVQAALERAPAGALEARLRALDDESAKATETESSLAGARDWMRKSIWRGLAARALEKRDVDLASRLLGSGPPPLRVSETGRELGRLSTGGSVIPRVAGRAVGLVLGVRTDAARRRSAEVAAGMSRALGLPASAAVEGAVRLLTRDDGSEGGGVRRALAELAGEGAAVLVAGVDDVSSLAASRYAEVTGIPVLLLRRPDELPAKLSYTFVVGVSHTEVTKVLVGELASRGARTVERVGEGGVSCAVRVESAGRSRFPIATWKKSGVEGLIVDGGAGCANDVMADVRASKLGVTLALGLDCAELVGSKDVAVDAIAAAAGNFPFRGGDTVPGDMTAWVEDHRSPPTWHEALGHDAAVLARAALREFPLQRVDDQKAVAELHRRAARALMKSEAELWSTRERGFGGRTILRRELRVVSP